MGLILNSLTSFELTGLLLRDFFIASDHSSLAAAYSALAPDAPVASLTAEYDFNALFIGPQALKAAPYASVYLDEGALVMGKTTLEFREFMQQLGLSINNDNHLPDDHISYELELSVLLFIHTKQYPEFKVELHRYVFDYITRWVPLFILNIKENAQTVELKKVANMLSDWLDEFKLRVSQ